MPDTVEDLLARLGQQDREEDQHEADRELRAHRLVVEQQGGQHPEHGFKHKDHRGGGRGRIPHAERLQEEAQRRDDGAEIEQRQPYGRGQTGREGLKQER